MMIDEIKLAVRLGTGTHLLAMALLIMPVDLWTLCGVTNPLQDGRLSGVCPSKNEDSELDITGDEG
jgi:hypothetical protein